MAKATSNRRPAQADKDLAKYLYTHNNLTNKEISIRLGITEKTIGKWVTDGNWDDMRKSMLVTNDELIRCFLDQISELNKEIRNESNEVRYANSKQADTYIKLTAALKNLYTDIGLSEIMEVCNKLVRFTQANFPERLKDTIAILDAFVQTQIK